jgi:hypothetical protein
MRNSDLRLSSLSFAVICITGLIIIHRLKPEGAPETVGLSIPAASYLFFYHEPVPLALSCVFLIGCFLWTFRVPATRAREPVTSAKPWPIVRVAALVVLVFTGVGTFLVYRWFPLSMDEYLVRWPTPLFLDGRVTAPVAPEYRPYVDALTPGFVKYNHAGHFWNSGYLPVYAGVHALVSRLGLGEMLNPLLSAATILMIALVARQLWPNVNYAPWLSALLLATSSQFLITGMSFYTYPGHLLLNLVWLWLYLREDASSTLVLPWVGVIAMGLHFPFVHAFFVLPFLIRILRRRPWGATVYLGTVYLAGCLFWFWWLKTYRHMVPAEVTTEGGAPTSTEWAGRSLPW